MSENDLIAEYVKERYPELLTTFDFAAYKFGAIVRETRDKMAEALMKIDFSGLNEAIHKMTESAEKEGILLHELLPGCTGCIREESGNNIKRLICSHCKRGKIDTEGRYSHEDLFVKKDG